MSSATTRITNWPGLIQAYRQYLPVSDATPIVTLNEGNTPLIPSMSLSQRLDAHGRARVHLKFDGANPTGSFKDRGMTMAISKAKEEGSTAVICASTGNTSASAAAYAARAGMACGVLIPNGNIALGKLSQALLYGAKVFAVDGNFDVCMEMVRALSESHPVTIVNSINPYRIQGQKTAAFEICDQLGGRPPDYQVMPVGNAGNITAYWLGYTEAQADGRIDRRPVMLGFQARGANPIVRGERVLKPETLATAIRIGNPASWQQALDARDQSGGLIDDVSDSEIIAAYRHLAAVDGVICEPSSASSVAGLFKLSDAGYWREGLAQRTRENPLEIVCILTGHGLKDPERAIAVADKPIEIRADVNAVAEHLAVNRFARDGAWEKSMKHLKSSSRPENQWGGFPAPVIGNTFETHSLVPYEQRLSREPRWAMDESDRFFEGKSGVHATLRKITQRLNELNLPYSVVGGMALFEYGFRRFTEDVDILMEKTHLQELHEKVVGLGYLPPFDQSKNLRDVETGVKIEFLLSGQFPGDGKPKPVSFPRPLECAVERDGIKYIAMPKLIEMKLASGISEPSRMKDLSDVQELIRILDLPEKLGDQLNEYVRPKFVELWRSVKRRYVLLWRKDHMADAETTAELSDMKRDGVVMEESGDPGDHVRLVTDDAVIAEKYGMRDESEHW